jgi:hypothetical protein
LPNLCITTGLFIVYFIAATKDLLPMSRNGYSTY